MIEWFKKIFSSSENNSSVDTGDNIFDLNKLESFKSSYKLSDRYLVSNKLSDYNEEGYEVFLSINRIFKEIRLLKVKPKHSNDKQKENDLNFIIQNMKNLDHPYVLKLFESYEDKSEETKMRISSSRFMIPNFSSYYLFFEYEREEMSLSYFLMKYYDELQRSRTENRFGLNSYSSYEYFVRQIIFQLLYSLKYIDNMYQDKKSAIKIQGKHHPNNRKLIEGCNNFYTLYTLENIRISHYDDRSIHVKTKLTNFTKLESKDFYDYVNYFAPEVLEHKNQQMIDEKTYVWNIGVIMYCMAFNNFPFYGVNEREVKYNIISSKTNSHKFTLNSIKKLVTEKYIIDDYSDSFMELLKNMLAYDKSYRFNLDQCLDHVYFKQVYSKFIVGDDEGMHSGSIMDSSENNNVENLDLNRENFKKQQRMVNKNYSNKYEKAIDRNILFGDRKCYPYLAGYKRELLSMNYDVYQVELYQFYKNLKQFQKLTIFQRILIIFTIQKIKNPKKSLIVNTFLIIDQYNNGYLKSLDGEVIEFKIFLQIVESTEEYFKNWKSDNLPDLTNPKSLDQEAKDLFNVIDIDGSNSVQFSEFMAAVTDISYYLNDGMIHKLIDLIDYDRSGTIEFSDFGPNGLGLLQNTEYWRKWVQPLHTYLKDFFIPQHVGRRLEQSEYARLVADFKIDELSLTTNMFKFLFHPGTLYEDRIEKFKESPEDLRDFFQLEDSLKYEDFEMYRNEIDDKIKNKNHLYTLQKNLKKEKQTSKEGSSLKNIKSVSEVNEKMNE